MQFIQILAELKLLIVTVLTLTEQDFGLAHLLLYFAGRKKQGRLMFHIIWKIVGTYRIAFRIGFLLLKSKVILLIRRRFFLSGTILVICNCSIPFIID